MHPQSTQSLKALQARLVHLEYLFASLNPTIPCAIMQNRAPDGLVLPPPSAAHEVLFPRIYQRSVVCAYLRTPWATERVLAFSYSWTVCCCLSLQTPFVVDTQVCQSSVCITHAILSRNACKARLSSVARGPRPLP